MATPAPGWYPNPDGTASARYWDGAQWTEHVDPPDAGSTEPPGPLPPPPTSAPAPPSPSPAPPDPAPSSIPPMPPPMPPTPPPPTGLWPGAPGQSAWGDPGSGAGMQLPPMAPAVAPHPSWDRYPTGGARSSDNTGVAALVLGILAYPLALLCGLLAIPAGIAAIVVGIVGLVQANQALPPRPKGMAIAGIALGAGAIVFMVVALVFLLLPFSGSFTD